MKKKTRQKRKFKVVRLNPLKAAKKDMPSKKEKIRLREEIFGKRFEPPALLTKSGRGRPQIFETPESLAEEFVTYATWSENTPIMISKQATIDGMPTLQEVPYRRPMSLPQFCIWCHASEDWLKTFRSGLQRNGDPDNFLPVIRAIRDAIDNQLFEGASVGQFNANLISRKLGLAEKTVHELGDRERVANAFPTEEEFKLLTEKKNERNSGS